MTVEEWGALDEEVLGELVDGRLVDEEEGSLVDAVHTAPSIVAVSDCPGGVPRIVLASGVKFVIGPRTGRRADGSIYFAGGQPEPC